LEDGKIRMAFGQLIDLSIVFLNRLI